MTSFSTLDQLLIPKTKGIIDFEGFMSRARLGDDYPFFSLSLSLAPRSRENGILRGEEKIGFRNFCLCRKSFTPRAPCVYTLFSVLFLAFIYIAFFLGAGILRLAERGAGSILVFLESKSYFVF